MFDIAGATKKLEELDQQMSAQGFWDDPEAAQKIVQERKRYLDTVEPWNETQGELSEAKEFAELLAEEEELDTDMLADLGEQIDALEKSVGKLEFKKMLSGEQDASNAILTINAGAGGTEAQDWAEILLRMYLRYCERQEWKTEIVELSEGEEAGIKSATVTVAGPFAYGYLKAEIGVHRLVRISPFDSNKRRQTSFASVCVCPEVDDDIDIEVREEDLRVDTYRSSGAGGQHVNKTDSAVRLTHIPTGIVVACQAERSQHKNKAKAMKLLQAKIYQHELQKRQAE
ncbi:MAG: peptide chain release factor 2, partial [Chrysiogenetes bacterium]|nr:peptide chain release factor 2 [Chrysiogenetes bacterium]